MTVADDLVATAAAAHRRFVAIQDTIGALIEDAWITYANLDDVAAARFTTAASTIVEGGLRQVADGVSGYVTNSDNLLGHTTDLALRTPTIRGGVPLDDVYQRSIVEARRRIAAGESYADAMRAGQQRAVSAAKTDMSLGNRAAMTDARAGRPWVVGYRRTLTGKSCSFCALASTQRYKSADLLPLHPACDCGIAEIYGKDDPGQIINRELLTDLKAKGAIGETSATSFAPTPKAWAQITEEAFIHQRTHSPDLTRAVDRYTGSSYKPINRGLRGQRDITPEVQLWIDTLDDGFRTSAYRLPSDVVLYRQVDVEMIDDFFAKGAVFSDPGYTSTAARAVDSTTGPGIANVRISVRRGTDVLPGNSLEDELILPRGSSFKIINVDRATRTVDLELQ